MGSFKSVSQRYHFHRSMSATNKMKLNRKYDAPRRRANAVDTRTHILDAALQLLADRGYVGTTIEAIAAQAGVGERTVYDTFGSKQGILLGLIESFSPIPKTDFQALTQAGAADPQAQLRLIVNFVIDYFCAAEQFLDVLRANAGANPALAAIMREGEQLRRESQRDILHNWANSGVLKRELSATRAGDILWGLTSPDVYRLFVQERKWTRQSYARWLFQTLRQLLFARP
jgi:AcrR family transcriptional regulator